MMCIVSNSKGTPGDSQPVLPLLQIDGFLVPVTSHLYLNLRINLKNENIYIYNGKKTKAFGSLTEKALWIPKYRCLKTRREENSIAWMSKCYLPASKEGMAGVYIEQPCVRDKNYFLSSWDATNAAVGVAAYFAIDHVEP
ncbi:hypothetical protein EGR_07224 [Echinococcus granulosus]|uniref:Uncharacterized protein n=1 Tax=Echinococcus granulosus TaxID=6210 RepID=W6UWV4_ECHGR|nr:hypothetical protein EGR_07224 [Echinococcus granulosus]EUB57954.1 hypothetical protein EGR_07224 [Echinococcus granulosus]